MCAVVLATSSSSIAGRPARLSAPPTALLRGRCDYAEGRVGARTKYKGLSGTTHTVRHAPDNAPPTCVVAGIDERIRHLPPPPLPPPRPSLPSAPPPPSLRCSNVELFPAWEGWRPTRSAKSDSSSTRRQALEGRQAGGQNVVSWYGNECGCSNRLACHTGFAKGEEED
eukprot:GHVU01023130.1.p1 GENE.GHVU01023130.1~~GHVU01023130.1.p1  ORF type:complete len:169 (-),score=19.38 GHVU01023130.1:279-785(-)